MKAGLRPLRALLAAAELGAISRAAEALGVTQPAAAQAMARLERDFGAPLLLRTPQGVAPTEAGAALAARVRRAVDLLDPALAAVAPRLRLTATAAQLRALVALRETGSFTLAAARLGVAQPTIHRAVTDIEREAGRALFARGPRGARPTRAAEALARAARLAFAELDQAEADLAELAGREVGRIVVGAMPLSRASVLPQAIAAFRRLRPTLPLLVRDGPYEDLLAGLSRGEIDLLIGALRDPAPADDVTQETLFADDLVVVAGRRHPLLTRPDLAPVDLAPPDLAPSDLSPAALARWPWVVARAGTPTRAAFDRLFAGGPAPASIVESGSIILVRELLDASAHLGCISRLQARAEAARGLMTILPVAVPGSARPIGLTLRAGWLPTAAQRDLLRLLRAAGESAPGGDAGA